MTPDRPWRSLGIFQPAEIEDKFALWISMSSFIVAQGVKWEPFKAEAMPDIRHQTPDTYKCGSVGWHPDGNAEFVVVWASCDPTMIRWKDWDVTYNVPSQVTDTPAPYEVALIDNRRAEHCAPRTISGPRWFYRAFVKERP